MNQTVEVGRYMDDQLYEVAARLQGPDIPSFADADDDVFRRLTLGDQSNVLHIAARCGNQAFISTVAVRVPATFHHELLCKPNSKGETPLHLAAQFGDVDTVRTLLEAHDVVEFPLAGDEKKPCWSEMDHLGDTPLHKALRYGHDDIALLLLKRDVQVLVSLDNKVGESPAYLAVDNFCPKSMRTILGADSYNQCSVSFSGPFDQTAFHPASKLNEEILSNLIERKKQLLHVQDNKGKTVLHYAVEENNEPIVKTLLKADSSLGYSHDMDGLTPLHRAAMLGFFPIVQTILKLSPQSIDIRDKDHGKTALHLSKMEPGFLAGCMKKTRMKELINEVDNDGRTVLHLALMNSDMQCANTLLEVNGIKWRLKDKNGLAPMDLCKPGDVKLKYVESRWREQEITERMLEFFRKREIRNVDDLLKLDHNDYDSCLDYRGRNGDSIFHMAARDGRVNIIRKVVQSNNSHSNHLLLLEQNSKGETPLHLAAEYGELQIVEVIVSLCNRLQKENPQSQVENGEANLVHDLKPWRMQSGNGDTPAHKAVRNRHSNIVLSLLRLEPELASFVNEEGESLLYLAAEKRCDAVLNQILNFDGNEFSISGLDGRNPLHAAVRYGGMSSVSSLVKSQPNLVNKVDHSGKTPLHHATEVGRHHIISKLLENDKAAAFIYDNQGFTPLLRAAAKGFLLCVTTIIAFCPLCLELRDLNSMKTMVHLTKVTSSSEIVTAKLRSIWSKQVNECDRDGNTALHSAILDNNIQKAFVLLRTRGINWRIRNKFHQMPLDICKQMIQNGNEEQEPIYKALERREQRRHTCIESYRAIYRNIWGKFTHGFVSMKAEELKQLMDSVVVVAALFVTITFAALFTIPGGYNQNNGEAEQMKDPAIQAFVALDVYALLLNIGVLLKYGYYIFFGSVLKSPGTFAKSCIMMLQHSLIATTLAFICGLYAIVSHSSAIWIFILSVIAAVLYTIVP